jgi:hypothetical protein
VIRFSAFLVAVAVGLLVAGVVTSKLLLVYTAIGVSGVALLALGIGAAVNWRELTGKPTTAVAGTSAPAAAPAHHDAAPAHHDAAPATPAPAATATAAAQAPAHPQAQVPAAASAAAVGSGWSAAVPATPSAPSRAGYLPTEQPQKAQPAAARPVPSADPFPPAAQPQPPVRPQPPQPQPAAAKPPVAFTPHREPPARDVWEWRDDSIQAPPSSRPQAPARPAAVSAAPETFSPFRPVGKPAPPGSEEAAERPSGASPPPGARSPGADHPPPEDPPPADRQDKAELAASARGPESATVVAAGSAVGVPVGAQAEEPEKPEQVNAPEQVDQTGQAEEAEGPEPAGLDPDMEVTVVPGVPRYHNARCILIRFMGEDDLDKMTRAAAREAGCTPCRACLPDQLDKSPE